MLMAIGSNSATSPRAHAWISFSARNTTHGSVHGYTASTARTRVRHCPSDVYRYVIIICLLDSERLCLPACNDA
jgi:hypothetical protein